MAQTLYFSRDSKCFIEFSGHVWEVPVLDGFSFSQATNSSEITLSEMEGTGGASKRGRKAFNDSLAPGEWSISTYARPFAAAVGTAAGTADSAAETHAVEEALWALMAGANTYDRTTFDWDYDDTNVITPAVGSSAINFTSSNKGTLSTFNMYFVLGDSSRKVMKLSNCTVNEASMDFDIEGITTIAWSGNCTELTDFTGSVKTSDDEPNNGDTTADSTTIAVGDVWLDSNDSYRLYVMTNVGSGSEDSTTPVFEGTDATTNFIRNRLTTMTVAAHTNHTGQSALQGNSGGTSGGYSLTLTGGNVTISNNITYVTPEELGIVNVPFAHVTGTRSVSGSFTCYVTEDDSGSVYDSVTFFQDLRSISSVVTNKFNVTMKIGGATGNRVELAMPTCHIEIPTHSIEDVISLETNFMALPSSIDGTDELTLTYGV